VEKRKIPKYVLKNLGLQTQRQFKALKRHQIRQIMKALDDYRMGCAYCHGRFDVGEIAKRLEKCKKQLSVKEWGR